MIKLQFIKAYFETAVYIDSATTYDIDCSGAKFIAPI